MFHIKTNVRWHLYVYICLCIHIYSQTSFNFSLFSVENFLFSLCLQRDVFRIKDVRRSKFLRTHQDCSLNFWFYRRPTRYLWPQNAAKRSRSGWQNQVRNKSCYTRRVLLPNFPWMKYVLQNQPAVDSVLFNRNLPEVMGHCYLSFTKKKKNRSTGS